jgi:hypothetical protein
MLLLWHGFAEYYIKSYKMKKHIKNFVALHAAQFKEVRKSLAIKKNPRYIYT